MHFFLAGVLFGKDSPKFGLFLPIQATLSPIYALFGILLIGLSCAGVYQNSQIQDEVACVGRLCLSQCFEECSRIITTPSSTLQ